MIANQHACTVLSIADSIEKDLAYCLSPCLVAAAAVQVLEHQHVSLLLLQSYLSQGLQRKIYKCLQ